MKLTINESDSKIVGINNLTPGLWESEDWIFFVSEGITKNEPEFRDDLPVHILGWDRSNNVLDTPSVRYWSSKTFVKLKNSVTLSN